MRILLLVLVALAMPCMAGEAPKQASTPAIEMGLYQSGHMELDSPEAAEGPYRLFLRLFGDGRVSMVLSPAEAEEVYQQFDGNRHMAGKIEYTFSPDGISFDFGPTAHSVTAIGEARIRLQSVYPNGRENQEELTLVIPERQP